MCFYFLVGFACFFCQVLGVDLCCSFLCLFFPRCFLLFGLVLVGSFGFYMLLVLDCLVLVYSGFGGLC